MKNFLPFILPFFFLLLAGCAAEKDLPPPSKTTLLTLTTDGSFLTSHSDDYVIVNNAAGEVLGFKAFESNSVVTIETDVTDPGDSVVVTFLQETDSLDWAILYSYHGIPAGDHLTLQRKPGFRVPAEAGKVTINISNLGGQSLLEMILANRTSAYAFGGDNVFSAYAPINGDADDFLLTYIKPDGTLKQQYFENLPAGGAMTLDDADVPGPEHVVEYQVPPGVQTNIGISGREAGQAANERGYVIQSYSGTPSTPFTLKTGYPSRLTQFMNTIYVFPKTAGPLLTYFKKGSLSFPSSWPEASSFTLVTSAEGKFEYTSTANPRFHRSAWTGNAVLWYTYSTSHTTQLPQLPTALTDLYPGTVHTGLEYAGTVYYLNTSYTFSDYISRELRNQEEPAEVEYTSIEIN